jgi:transposase
MLWTAPPPARLLKRHKNGATDAEAICEAVARANMRFVTIKTPEQQSCLILHRTSHLLIRQQTSVINASRTRRRRRSALYQPNREARRNRGAPRDARRL